MFRLLRLALAAAVIATTLAVIAPAPTARAATPFTVGAAKVDITPSDADIAAGNIWLGGFGNCADTDRKATGVLDRIHARAIVISDGTTTVAWVVTDVPGQSNRRVTSIQDKAATATGIPKRNIMVAAQHTHSGPDMQGIWCGVSDSYKSFYDQRVADAVSQAHADRRPATLHAGTRKLTGMNSEHRGWGFTDEDLATVQAVDGAGAPIATWVTFAAHATFLGDGNKLISRDWPGAAADQIEARGGGIALLNVGAPGAVGPNWPVKGETGMREYGTAVADAALDNLPAATELSAPLVYKTAARNIRVDNGTFLLAYTAGWLDYDLVYPCVEGGGIFGKPCISTDVAYLRFGPPGACQLQAGTAPGELLTRGSQRVKQGFTAPTQIILGLTHNTLGYGVPGDEWNAAPNGDTYHESVSPTKSFGDTVVSTIGELRASDSC